MLIALAILCALLATSAFSAIICGLLYMWFEWAIELDGVLSFALCMAALPFVIGGIIGIAWIGVTVFCLISGTST